MPRLQRYPIHVDGDTVAIGSASELAVTLDVLQGQYDRHCLEQLAPHLAQIIGNAAGLLNVLRVLSIEDRIFLIQSIGAGLAPILQDAAHLRDVLAVLSDQGVEAVLFDCLGEGGLGRLIQSGAELAEVLEWVYGHEDALVLDLLGTDRLRRLCRQAGDLGAVLHNLGSEQQVALLDRLGWDYVVERVRDGQDLAVLLRALPHHHSQELLRHFDAGQLRSLIGSVRQWQYLYQRLEPAEAEILLEKFTCA